MIYLVIGAFVLWVITTAALLYGIYYLLKVGLNYLASHDALVAAERSSWREERHQLLERIQRPEVVPVTPTTEGDDPEPSFHDELHLVGTIREDSNPPPLDAA